MGQTTQYGYNVSFSQNDLDIQYNPDLNPIGSFVDIDKLLLNLYAKAKELK